MCQLSPVTFHGDTIFCIDYQNQPFTPMKPIVQNMGLDWSGQAAKLNANKERWGVSIIEIPSNGGEQEMLCMPVRKLPSYLNSINPRKVRPELRAKIELYQAESDDALWNYWMHGRAERPVPQTAEAAITPDQQCTLQAIVRARVEGIPAERRSKGLYPQIWSRFNNHFRLGSYKQLPQCRMSEAVAYLTRMEPRPCRRNRSACPCTATAASIRRTATGATSPARRRPRCWSCGRTGPGAKPASGKSSWPCCGNWTPAAAICSAMPCPTWAAMPTPCSARSACWTACSRAVRKPSNDSARHWTMPACTYA